MMTEEQKGSEMLGKVDIELSNYVGKFFEEVTLPLGGGRIKNGLMKVKISVCKIHQAPQIGVDPSHLLEGVPPHMRQLRRMENTNAET